MQWQIVYHLYLKCIKGMQMYCTFKIFNIDTEKIRKYTLNKTMFDVAI